MSEVQIRALDQRAHLLKRMNLIFGAVEGPGVNYSTQKATALREILDNALDESRAGHGEHVKISFYKDRSFEVYDSGRGIPVTPGTDAEGRPASQLYLALGVLQSGGKFETDSKRFSSGLNGLGGAATVQVSTMATAKVYRDKKVYELHFKDGQPGFFADDTDPTSKFTPVKKLTDLKTSKDTRTAAEKKKYPTGTKIRVWLNDSVFSSSKPYDDQDIIERFRATAFLVPTLHGEVYNELKLIDGKPQQETYHFPNGIEDLIELSRPDEPITSILHFQAEGKYIEKNVAVLKKDGTVKNESVERTVPIEVAMQWGEKYDSNVHTFVNTINTKLHGSHLVAFQRAMTSAFNERFQSMRGVLTKNDPIPLAEDFEEGLTAVISVQVSEPTFTNQSKEELSGREVQKAIQDTLTKEFTDWINDRKNASTLAVIAKKVVAASKNRQKALDQRDLARKKNKIASSSLPLALIDCEHAGSEAAELYICEGESAVTSLKAARDGQINALLGLRGKIINAHKEPMKRVIASEQVQNIIKTLGAGAGNDFDINKMRYGRIFIAVDADPDGNSIATYIYALFWHLFRDVITEGRLYKIEPPLFVFSTKEGKKSRKLYAANDAEKDKIVRSLESKNIKYSGPTRLKGLGEMKADTLEETAINPETRIITQISLDDVEEATRVLDVLLGTDTGPRKEWIESSEVPEELIKE